MLERRAFNVFRCVIISVTVRNHDFGDFKRAITCDHDKTGKRSFMFFMLARFILVAKNAGVGAGYRADAPGTHS